MLCRESIRTGCGNHDVKNGVKHDPPATPFIDYHVCTWHQHHYIAHPDIMRSNSISIGTWSNHFQYRLALRVELICEGQCAPVQTSSQG